MKRTAPGLAPRSFYSLFRDGVSTGLTDKELLERFAACRDDSGELAFATLVARHGPMVLSVCRRMLRDPHESDDAFQATFLILVRKRGSVRFEASLGPWLFGVSVRVARRARNLAARRRPIALDDATAELAIEGRAAADADLRFAIDELLAGLPANYRSAIVLCYLEGLTHEEAADRLRCPVGTVRSRLARGRAILKERLNRAGLAPAGSATDLNEHLDQRPAPAVVAPQLLDLIARSATRLAHGVPLSRIVPTQIVKLVSGVTQTMTISRFATVASLLIFAGLAACGAAGLAAQTPGRTGQESPPPSTSGTVEPTFAANSTIDSTSENQTSKPDDKGSAQELSIPDDLPPVVVNVEPKLGAIDVDPALKEIRVKFSKKMTDKSWSWPSGNKYATPESDGEIHFEPDGRTCVMPVKLEPGKTYVLGVNSERHRNFKDTEGRPALPYLVVFRTKGAG